MKTSSKITMVSIFALNIGIFAQENKQFTAPIIPMLQAIKSGNNQQFKKLLNAKEFANTCDICNENGTTPLMLAAFEDQLEITNLLLAAQVKIDKATLANKDFHFTKPLADAKSGSTALMLACAAGNLKIVCALLKAGANPNAKDTNGQNALIYAILSNPNWPHQPLEHKRKDIIQILLKAGANPKAQDIHGLNALYYYKFLAGLVPGYGYHGYDFEEEAIEKDDLYRSMSKI